MSKRKAFIVSKKGDKFVYHKKREMIPLWKFYVPFICIALILFGKYFYSKEGLIFHYVFPISEGALSSSIFITLLGVFFIVLIARRYYWRECLSEKWNDIEFGFGMGLWLSIIPALFLMNSLFVFILWLNDLYTEPLTEKSYWLKDVEIFEPHHSSPARYSSKPFIHSYPHAELEIGSTDDPYNTKYAYCSNSAKLFINIDSVKVIVKHRHGWLGFDIIESIKFDLSNSRERVTNDDDELHVDSVFDESPVYQYHNSRIDKKLKELFEELEKKAIKIVLIKKVRNR
jgi:hypothetical protein